MPPSMSSMSSIRMLRFEKHDLLRLFLLNFKVIGEVIETESLLLLLESSIESTASRCTNGRGLACFKSCLL
jgi:hypothetical protein